jgi:Kef-type K+ transport system membrane component KefB
VASLVLIALLIPLVTGQDEPTLGDILLITIKALLFFVLVVVFATMVFPGKETVTSNRFMSFMYRLGLHDILAFSSGKVATLALLTIAIIFGIVAYYFGLHPAVGAYMAGLIMRKEYFYHHKHGKKVTTYKKTRKIIDDVAFAWIGPIFFVNLGAKLVLEPKMLMSIVDTTVLLTITIIAAQILSASLAAHYTARFNFKESMMIGFGMLGRAELAFVVMDIAYVQNNIFTTEVFYTLMFTAFALNIAVPLCIKFWHPYFSNEKKLFWQNKNIDDH